MHLSGLPLQLFGGLRACVQYKARPERPDVSPTDWVTMAAFDVRPVADDYMETLRSEIWEYRVVDVPVPDLV